MFLKIRFRYVVILFVLMKKKAFTLVGSDFAKKDIVLKR